MLGTAVYWFGLRTTDEERYVDALKAQHLYVQFGTREAAVTQGRAFCAKLDAGQEPVGYRSQQVAVKELCPAFAKGFTVVPTPAELQSQFASELRDKGLGGKFASDVAAAAFAKRTCSRLDAGGAQQGPAVDAVAVSVYCPKYSNGFTTLERIHVKATFGLKDSDPSSYFPDIVSKAGGCSGTSGYSDITAGREVLVKDGAGDLLTTTTLRAGHGSPPFSCTFDFSFTVLDGAKGGYSITVANRGDVHFSAAQLKIPGAVGLTLGD
ncbi:hypothetical protein [Nocardioides terrisoli]|uniref:hypothetical protein n=1 Tax=Nocardioides terrisoli TaxID=3388267 RepID=UPI00287BBF47|nr:hypothetical protein [Nocardioides marmorisolisilvae]